MRSPRIVAFAILGVFLVISVAPVSAASAELAVGSQRTDFGTDSEPSPAVLENTTVEGTGTSASVTLKGGLTIEDGFEDGDIAEWSGDTASYEADTTRTKSGSYALHLASSGSTVNINRNITSKDHNSVRFSANLNTVSNDLYPGVEWRDQSGTIGMRISVDDGSQTGTAGRIIVYNGSAYADTGITINPDSWYEIRATNIDYSSNTFDVKVYDGQGNLVGESQNHGFYFDVSSIGNVKVFGNTDEFWIDDIGTGEDVPPEGTYISANHSVSQVAEIAANLTLSNANATITSQYWDGSQWVTANSTEVSSSGNHSLSVPDVPSSVWRTNVTFQKTGESPTAKLHDESYLFDAKAPEVSNVKPADGTYVDSTETLSADISDTDFATAQNDSVTVKFLIDGSVVGTDTLSQNGTASTTWEPSTAGAHDYTVRATDSYGEETTSATRTLNVANELVIRNETNTSEILDDINGTAEVTFFGSSTVKTVTITNGTADMTGLPADEAFIAEIDVEGFYSRTVYITSLLEQRNVYLLHTNESSVESRFTLEDPTGSYPPETVLVVEKAISLNGSVQYRTLYADRFGIEGVTAQLAKGARYQISVRAPDGTAQTIGPYRADVGETVTVQPGSPTIELGSYENGWASNAVLDNRTLEYRYSDPDNLTSSLTIWIHEKGNVSNELRPNTTYTDLGNASGTYTLTENESKKTWVVNFVVDRDGKEFTSEKQVANKADLVPSLSREWRLIAGISLLFISAGVFSLLNAGVGGVIVSVEGGLLWWTGWLDGATTGAAVVIALFVAVTFHIYSSG